MPALPSSISNTAMVLAAGLGTRMRPLTLTTPKPLLKVGGRTMVDHAIDKLKEAGVTRVVVNSFYLGEQVMAHAGTRKDIEIILSPEDELLDTGGGVKKALRHFGDKPFFVLNADLPWFDDPARPSLTGMAQNFDATRMDAMLLLMPRERARGFGKEGGFAMEQGTRLRRTGKNEAPAPCVMISAQIVKPESYAAISETKFSNNSIWDMAAQHDRLYGHMHHGTCYHVGTPEDLEQANALLASGKGWG